MDKVRNMESLCNELWDSYHPPRHIFGSFNCAELNGYLKIFRRWLSQMAFGEKKHEFGQKKLLSILYFWTLKNNTRNFNFRSKEPSPDLQGLLVRYDYPWKKIHINACKKYFFCQRNRKFHCFVDETSTEAISDTLNLKM